MRSFFNFSNRTYRTGENSVRSCQPFTFQHVDKSSSFTSYGKNNLKCNRCKLVDNRINATLSLYKLQLVNNEWGQ